MKTAPVKESRKINPRLRVKNHPQTPKKEALKVSEEDLSEAEGVAFVVVEYQRGSDQ